MSARSDALQKIAIAPLLATGATSLVRKAFSSVLGSAAKRGLRAAGKGAAWTGKKSLGPASTIALEMPTLSGKASAPRAQSILGR